MSQGVCLANCIVQRKFSIANHGQRILCGKSGGEKRQTD